MWIFGAGGFGRDTLDACLAAGFGVQGFLDENPGERKVLRGLPIVHPSEARAGLFVVAIADPTIRRRIHHEFVDEGWEPVTVIDPRSVIGGGSSVGEGSVVLATAFVSGEVELGAANQINYQASVGHGSTFGSFCTVLPGAQLGGALCMRDEVMVGANATVMQGLLLGQGSTVGAGAVVTRDVAPNTIVTGVPARPT